MKHFKFYTLLLTIPQSQESAKVKGISGGKFGKETWGVIMQLVLQLGNEPHLTQME
jgi:hypothetical protein